VPATDHSPTTATDVPTRRAADRRAPSRALLAPGLALFVIALLAVASFGGAEDTAPDGGATPAASDVTDGADTEVTEQPLAETDTAEVEPSTPAETDGRLDLARREPDDGMAMGAVDAPVVLIEWADFQCRFCAVFARQTEPELVERYVADGILRIEWRDYPILGEESLTAALGGRAAAAQGAFWEYHAAVFAEDRAVESGELTADGLVTIAGELGLDTQRFEADLDDPALFAGVQRDWQEGQQLGITSTPVFLVDGHPVLGAQPLEVFTELIDAAASEAGR
jgi:protein-disulfide isomerase